MSRPSVGLGLDRIFKSRPVLVLVSFHILFQDMSWSCLKISFKRSLGIGLKRQKNQDKINTKKNDNKESKKIDFPPKPQAGALPRVAIGYKNDNV